GGGKGNDVMMGLGWGVVDKLLVGHGNAISGAVSDLGAGFDAVTKYLNKALSDELTKGWDGIAATMKTELAKAATNAGDLVDDMSSAGSSAVNAISGVAGLGSADFDIASALKSAINGGKSGLDSAINGIGSGVSYVADADVGSAISTAVSWTGDAISTASDASGSGVNWLGRQLGINLGLGDFKGMDFFISGFIAYTVGYKYAGNNRLWGGAGDDTFYSGMGNDHLHGAEGKDIFVMSMGDGKDTIHEVAGDGDILRFTGNKLFSDVAMGVENVKVNFEGSSMVVNYVSGGKSFAQFTVLDYKTAGIAQLEVVSAAGSTVGTLTMAQLEALGQQGESPYEMATVWTVDRLQDFAELVGNALTCQAA
ncbi:MAG: serralysin-like metalloprotease, partial [Pseudoduganella sp.]|nr:serralysin-like metalloprotease [Pseudoduganella sp.]